MLLISEIIRPAGRVPTRKAVEQERSEQLEEVRYIRRLLHQSPGQPEQNLPEQSTRRLARARGL